MKYALLLISITVLVASCVQAPPTKDQLARMSVDEINKQAVKLWKDG